MNYRVIKYLKNRKWICGFSFIAWMKVFNNCLIIIFFTGCFHKQTDDRYELKPIAEQIFPINEAIDPVSFAMFTSDLNGKEVFLYLNELDNSVLVFDMDGSDLLKEIRFDFEGQNGVGTIRGFCFINEDTIWLTSKGGHGKLYQANSDAQVINKYDFSDVSGFLGISFQADTKHPLVIRGPELFVPNYHPGPWSELPLEAYSKMAMGMRMNLQTEEMTSLHVLFPPDYWSEFKFPLYFSRVSDGKRLIYLFSYATKIYSHLLDGSTVDSKAIEGIGPFKMVRPASPYESMINSIRNPQNILLLYDKYRRVYYLMYYPGDSEIKIEDYDTRELALNLPHCEILVLDENFDLLTIYKNTRRFQYRLNNAFVGKEGLYVSVNNEFNPEMDEEHLRFQLFKLEKQ